MPGVEPGWRGWGWDSPCTLFPETHQQAGSAVLPTDPVLLPHMAGELRAGFTYRRTRAVGQRVRTTRLSGKCRQALQDRTARDGVVLASPVTGHADRTVTVHQHIRRRAGDSIPGGVLSNCTPPGTRVYHLRVRPFSSVPTRLVI